MTGPGFAPGHPLVRISRSSLEAPQAPQELDVASPSRLQSSDPTQQSEVLAHDSATASGLLPSSSG